MLPLDIKLGISPAGPVEGSVALSDEGRLSIDGVAGVTIDRVSLGMSVFQLPVHAGPIAESGSGRVRFEGTTTFPEFDGCDRFLSPVISTLIVRPGQPCECSIAPPAPTPM